MIPAGYLGRILGTVCGLVAGIGIVATVVGLMQWAPLKILTGIGLIGVGLLAIDLAAKWLASRGDDPDHCREGGEAA